MDSNVTTMPSTATTETIVRPFLEEYRLEVIIGSLSFFVAVIVLVMVACLCTRRRRVRLRPTQPAKNVGTLESTAPRAQKNQYVVQHSATQQKPPRKTSTTPSTTMQSRPHRTHRQQSETTVDRITDQVGKDLVKSSMIDSSRLTLKEVIGTGTFGDVYKGILLDQDMRNPQKVAVKTLTECTRDDEKKKEAFVKEALLMKGFKHKNVLCMLAIAFKKESPCVILPFMENGDLKTFLGKENRTFTVKDLVEFGIQVAEGMACLAENNYVHRDLAARNCLVDAKLVVKIADFGLVRDLHSDDYYHLQDLSTPLPIKWMALESVTQKKFSLRTDVWSYGIVLWEILTRGQKPYPGLDNAQVIKFIKKGKRMAAPPKCPPIVYNIMVRCWSAESSKRPSFKQIIQELKDILIKGTSKREASRIVEEYYTEPIPRDD